MMASRGVNKWIGICNSCADPETKFTTSGSAVANVTIACGDNYKDKNTGQTVEKTEFVRVVFFNRLAEIVGEYVRKGSKLYIEGALRTRKWQDQSGQDRYTTEIVASQMQMLDSRIGSGGVVPASEHGLNPGQQVGAVSRGKRSAPQQQAAPPPPPGIKILDTDIPF